MRGPIARATVRTTAALLLRLLAQAGTLLLVARLLGPEDFGAFAGVSALAIIFGTVSTFGTHLVLLGQTAQDPARRTDILAFALPTTLLCGTALAALYLVICTTVLRESGIDLSSLGMLAIAEILIQPLFQFPAAEQHTMGRIARSQLLITMPLIFRLTAAAIVFMISPSDPLASYVGGYLAASIVSLSIATWTMQASWPTLRQWRLPGKLEVRNAAGYAVLGITAIGPAELDKALAIKLLPASTAGVYAASSRVIGAATLPVIAMMLSALPRLLREGQAQPESLVRLVRWIFGAALFYSAALAAVLWISAPLFPELFGTSYAGVTTMLRWLCFVVPGMALRMAAGSILMALARPWHRASFEAIGLGCLLVAAPVLSGPLGVKAMPVALALSEWSMAIFGWLMVRRTMRIGGACDLRKVA